MPGKKKKYNARFPAGRIKKIMQTDEEVGKVAQAVPVIISRTLELFVESLLKKTVEITNAKNAKTLTPSHMKQCILSESRFDFLADHVRNIPDAADEDEVNNSNPALSRRRVSIEMTNSSKPASTNSAVCHSHHNHVSQQSTVTSTLAGHPSSHPSVQYTPQPSYAQRTYSIHQSYRYPQPVPLSQIGPHNSPYIPQSSPIGLSDSPYRPQNSQRSHLGPQNSLYSQYAPQNNQNTNNYLPGNTQIQISVPAGIHLPNSPVFAPGRNHTPEDTVTNSNHIPVTPVPHVKITIPQLSVTSLSQRFPIHIPTSEYPVSSSAFNGVLSNSGTSNGVTNTLNGMVPNYTPNYASNLVIDEDYDN